ncbi:phosphate ABC transporter permease PstA [Humisphaera borealis]|uniref:Phosphate transport system permease protein PstA n=1 Tax=Humisphaera borealis TaxID=2807512 RepID=A0A7M2WY10_9BACT|nr:phosphate ABC transporter permease PstA [Humisphaera borealis]QOV90365.1 phosphate ABC transporter permease PstA [Humisphaera borealis]
MTAITPTKSPASTNLPASAFHRDYKSIRTLVSVGLSVLAGTLTVVACIPLFSVLFMLIVRGGTRLLQGGLAIFTELPPGAMAKPGEGGFGNAIVGTLTMVVVAVLIAVPFGIMAAIFLTTFGARNPLSTFVRFAAKVMTGLPSILAGVFAYVAVVLLTGGFSAVAGGVALSVLMIPIVMLTAEEAIKMVPQKMKDAAIGMGCTPAQVTWKITIPSAMPGILTGVMLAVARAAGETAPLIFTAMMNNFRWAIDGKQPFVHLMRPTSSMAVFIYNSSASFSQNLIDLAWAASLVLVMMVLFFNIGGQLLSRGSRPKR